jgi:hypothetical protein
VKAASLTLNREPPSDTIVALQSLVSLTDAPISSPG